jgi:hypothetical protein
MEGPLVGGGCWGRLLQMLQMYNSSHARVSAHSPHKNAAHVCYMLLGVPAGLGVACRGTDAGAAD